MPFTDHRVTFDASGPSTIGRIPRRESWATP
jgi:hypothetical protein